MTMKDDVDRLDDIVARPVTTVAVGRLEINILYRSMFKDVEVWLVDEQPVLQPQTMDHFVRLVKPLVHGDSSQATTEW